MKFKPYLDPAMRHQGVYYSHEEYLEELEVAVFHHEFRRQICRREGRLETLDCIKPWSNNPYIYIRHWESHYLLSY